MALVVKRAFRVRLTDCATELVTEEIISTLYRHATWTREEYVEKASKAVGGVAFVEVGYKYGEDSRKVYREGQKVPLYEITTELIEIVVAG